MCAAARRLGPAVGLRPIGARPRPGARVARRRLRRFVGCAEQGAAHRGYPGGSADSRVLRLWARRGGRTGRAGRPRPGQRQLCRAPTAEAAVPALAHTDLAGGLGRVQVLLGRGGDAGSAARARAIDDRLLLQSIPGRARRDRRRLGVSRSGRIAGEQVPSRGQAQLYVARGRVPGSTGRAGRAGGTPL